MNDTHNIIGYIDYNNNLNKLEKIISQIFFKIWLKQIDYNKYEILINNCKLSNKKIIKIKSALNKANINVLAVSNNINKNQLNFSNNEIKLLTGKQIMKNSILKILEKIYNIQNKNMIFEELCVTIDNDQNIDIIQDLAEHFKYINIVTEKIRKLKRLDKKFENNNNFIYSISNNTKKSLKRAKIIVNFDYDENFFEKFNINRKAIIINLNSKQLNVKNSYQGVIIENIIADYNCDEKIKNKFKNFDTNILYETKIVDLKYDQIKGKCKEDNFVVKYLLGKNSIISECEFKNQ
jgi:hypothetical protein